MRRCAARFLLASILLVAPAAPAAADWGESYSLPNGLRVILSPDRRFPSVTVFVRYHVGARQEPQGRSGIAHLVEHLTFRVPAPSPHAGVYSSQFTVSSANGSTHFDQTDYYTTTNSADLKYALWKQRWRMGINLNHVDESVRRQELDVVRNERRQRIEIAPYSSGRDRLWNELFPVGHPYHDQVIGSMQDLASITLPEVITFLSTYYGPNNATLAVVGDFNPQEARTYVQQYYARLQGAAVPAPPATKPRELPDAILIRHAEPYGKNRRLHMAWHVPAAYAPDNAAGDVVARLLGGMEFSRIMANVPGAVFHTAFQESMLGGSVFHLLVEPKPDVDLETLQKQVDVVVNFLRAKAPSEDDVDHAVRRILSDRFGAMEDTLSKAEFLVDLITDGHATGDPLVFEQGRYKNVTPEDVRRFAEAYLTTSHRVILHSTPVGARR